MFRIMLVLLVASSTNLTYSCYENLNKNNDNKILFATYLESLSLSSETDKACSERIYKYTPSPEENSITLPQNASLIIQPADIDTETTPGSFALKKPWQMIFRNGKQEEQILWNKYPEQVTTEQISGIDAQSYAIASDLSKLAVVFEYYTLKWKGMGIESGSKILVPIIKEHSKKLEIFNLKTLEIILQKAFNLADQSRVVAISPGDSKEVIIKGMQNSSEEEKLLLFSPTENQFCVEDITKDILPEKAVHSTNFLPFKYQHCDFNRQGDALFIKYENPYWDSSFTIKKPDTEFSTKRIFAPTLVNKE